MDRPTYLLDIPADEYHAATKRNEYTTSHRLNLFRRCPALYKKTIDGEIVEGDTADFALGRATHTFILEGPDKFGLEYIVADGPVNQKTGKPYGKATKAYAEWAETMPLPVIPTEDFDLIEKMSEAVHAHKLAANIISQGMAEMTVRAEWSGEKVQSRLDWLDVELNVLVDLKTCADLDRFRFDIRDFGYVHQMAFYHNALKLAGHDTEGMRNYLIAVEKKEPFRVGVVEILPGTIYDANNAPANSPNGAGNNAMIEELKGCRASGVWPTRYEELMKI